MENKGWVQFLLVFVPVMSLVGSWLALRHIDRRRSAAPPGDAQGPDKHTKGEPHERG